MVISAGLAVILDEKILLVKPRGLDEGLYSIPKGHVEPGEGIFEAAIRETYEETGILISEKFIDRTPHICNYVSSVGSITKRIYYFIARVTAETINLTENIDWSEIEHYGFYDRATAEKLIYWKMLNILNHLNPSKFSLKELYILEKLNIVKKVKHPIYPIYLYNYTTKCKQFQFWNDTTLWCRGLVLDWKGVVIARPFKKFFEQRQLYDGFVPKGQKYIMREKIDGALGIMFFYHEKLVLCNRHSFKARQAVIAKEILYEKYGCHLEKLEKSNRTYLFEIIYPQSRFIVNYGNLRDVFILSIIENDSGRTIIEDTFFNNAALVEYQDVSNRKHEGVIIQYENDYKIKVKTESYKTRYCETENIKLRLAKDFEFLDTTDIRRKNWNIEYNKLYKIYKKKYIQLYLRYRRETNLSESEILEKISYIKVFPG